VELALKLDKDLIKLLLINERVKEHFFTEVDKILVFDKEKFMKFVDNKEFLPDSYTVFKQNIGLIDQYGRYFKSIPWNEVVLVWPYKDCILEGGQEKENEKREEVFHNEILAPDEIDRLLELKVFTNFKRIDKNSEHEVVEIKPNDNLIIKGNNLLVLHSLKKRFTGKVKLIYIDPPYNREVDTFYNDNFKHSTWLTFMKNRLEIAKDLLSNDGVIFVQIDDNEQAYLKVLMDEIFGKEKYEITLYVQVRYGQKTLTEKSDYQKLIEQILVYNIGSFKPIKEKEEYTIDKFEWKIIEKNKKPKRLKLGNRDVDVFFPDDYEIKRVRPSIQNLKETWASGSVLTGNASGKFFNEHISKRIAIDGLNVLYKVYGIGKDGLGYRYFTGPKREGKTKGKFYSGVPIERKEQLKEGKAFKFKSIFNYYNLADSFGNCRHEGGVELRSGKKPETLLKIILDISTNKGDLVLDFFSGTGTTCAVAHKMGRRYIGVEQLDYGENSAAVRLRNVINGDKTGISKVVNWKGGGDFIYCELMEINEKFIQKIQETKDTKELFKIWEEMKEHAFLSYKIEPKDIDENIEKFKDLSFENQKRFLIEVLDKNDLYVNFNEIEDKQYVVSKEDIYLNKNFYRGL